MNELTRETIRSTYGYSVLFREVPAIENAWDGIEVCTTIEHRAIGEYTDRWQSKEDSGWPAIRQLYSLL